MLKGGIKLALNKTILEKISRETESDINMKNLLIDLLQLESRGLGWYKAEYLKIISKYSKKGDVN